MTPSDWPAVEAIYAEGLATRNATFETETPSWGEFCAAHLEGYRLVAEEGERVVGWATLAPTSRRRCYSGVVESSVYVAAGARGKGIGRLLMVVLLERARKGRLWTVQTSVFPENEASIALHERLGFRIVGRRERLARLDGVWRDTLLLELRL
jgi:phosphinothricin acetyltransferase